MNTTAESRLNLVSLLHSLKNLEFNNEHRYNILKHEINKLYINENFPEWHKLEMKRFTFNCVKIATIEMITCALEDNIKKTFNNFLRCAENSRAAASALMESEYQQCVIYRSIIKNPFENIEIAPKSVFKKIMSWISHK